MTDDTPAHPTTCRVDPGLTRRLSMGMGTLTLAGAAFFGAVAPDTASATAPDTGTDPGMSTSSSNDSGEV